MSTPWTAVDIVTAALGAATVALAAVAVIVAIVAWIGYRDIRRTALRAAEKEARRIAEEVAAREIRAYLNKSGTPGAPDISAGYQDKP